MTWQDPDDFHRPFPSFPHPVPVPGVNPANEKLVKVCFNERWLPYILGALWQLTEYATWDTTDPVVMEETIAQAGHLLYLFQRATRCTPDLTASAGAEGAEDIMIRQNPDNPCLLETSINGTDWCPFADLSKCLNFPVQPASGTEQPATGGGQVCYNAYMPANEKWLLPTRVSSGDVITCSDFHGAGTDGAGSWQCPSGGTYILGTCGDIVSLEGGDPKPTSPHMMILAYIDGVYYQAYNATITVPGGISNAEVTFQVNDSNIFDNSGSYTWKTCVTNNQTGTWSHEFDFEVSSGGWSGVAFNSNDAPTYIPGVGWDSPDETNAAGVTRMLTIKRSGVPSRTYTSFTAKYEVSSASGTGTTEGVIAFPDENGASGVYFQSQTDGNGTYNSGAGFSRTDTAMAIRVQVDSTNGSTVAHAHIVLKKLTLAGLGTDPFDF